RASRRHAGRGHSLDRILRVLTRRRHSHRPTAVPSSAPVPCKAARGRLCSPHMSTYRIAVIPGDGIGKEVMPEGVRVLDAAARKFGFTFTLDHFDWNCDRLVKSGEWMPENWKDLVGGHHAIYFGATGWPAAVPDHVSLWSSLIKFRRDFDQYVHLRPVKLMSGIPCPLAGRKPGDIDYYVIRENTEGEYSSVGGRMFEGTDREFVTQQSCFTRKGVDRIMRFAFELAVKRVRRHVTSATKSNGIS